MATRPYPTGCPVELTSFHLPAPMAAIDLPELDSLQAEQWDRHQPPAAAQLPRQAMMLSHDSCRSVRAQPPDLLLNKPVPGSLWWRMSWRGHLDALSPPGLNLWLELLFPSHGSAVQARDVS